MDKVIPSDIEASGIYQIRNLLSGKLYIGSAKCFRKRWAAHRSGFKNGNHGNRMLMRSWLKYGPTAFTFEIVETCDVEALIQREQHWIDTAKPEYNLSPTAGNCLGVRHTEDAKRKMAVSHLGNNYCLGREISEETRKRISVSNKGKLKGVRQSPDQVARRAEAHRGMKRSEETRRKISEASKGKKRKQPRSAEHRTKLSAARKGKILSPESIAKMKESKRRNPQVFTEERRRRVSETLKAQYASGARSRDRSPEYRAKIAATLSGRPLAEETKRKIGTFFRGRKRGPYKKSLVNRNEHSRQQSLFGL